MILFSRKKHEIFSPRNRWFKICLSFSFANVFFNVVRIFIKYFPENTPCWLNYLITVLCFASTAVVIAALSLYFIAVIYKQSQHKFMRYISQVAVLVSSAILFVFSLHSPATHAIFYFDKNNVFQQGTFFFISIFSVAICAVVSIIGVIVERKSVDYNIIVSIVSSVVVACLLMIGEYFVPGLKFGSTGVVFVNFLLFVSFQNKGINIDHLTGLGDRTAFYNSLICYANKHQNFKVIFVGLRSFKNINDKYGQRAGDSFIIKAANYLRSLDNNGFLYRFNGVDFVYVLPQISDSDFVKLQEKIIERFSHHWKIGYMQCMLHIRVADISYPTDVNNCNDLMTMVEGAIRLLKKSEINSELIHLNQKIRNEIFRRNELVDLIKQSTVCRNFTLCYQPVYDCNENRFVSAEALIRMNDQKGQPVSPSEFIPIAEEIGSVVNIGWYVLEEVCHFLNVNRNININSISINLSQQQFMKPYLVNRIVETLDKYDIEPSKLKLELTERIIEKDIDHVRKIMNLLKDKGISCYMDDFGTGYSNLFNVINLPFECIKFDRSLVCNINNNISSNKGQRFLIESLTRSFQFIGAKVIAEGVEQENEVKTIRELGVNMIQSFYFSKPLSEQKFLDFIDGQVKSEFA